MLHLTDDNSRLFQSSQLKIGYVNQTDNVSTSSISFATSTAVNYGFSLGAQRTSGGLGNFFLDFHNNSTTGSNILTVKNTGYVGIGTTDPISLLHTYSTVNATTAGAETTGILIQNNTGSALSGEAALCYKSYDTGSNYWYAGLNQSNRYEIAYGTSYINSNTKFTITTDGKVGINQVTPSYALDVTGTGRFTDALYAKGKPVSEYNSYSTTSSSTPTPTGNYKENEYYLTALAAGATFAAPGGAPVNGNTLLIRIKDNGTARTLAWNSIYRAVGVTLPTTTTASRTLYIGCIYNSTDSKWDVVSVVKQT